MDEDLYWLGFSEFSGVGPKRFQKLLNAFGTARDAWNRSQSDLETVLGKILTAQFITFRQTFSVADFARKLKDHKIFFLLLKDASYPKLLRELSTAPFVLYVKGDTALVSHAEKTFAVVGTRKFTEYGKEVTQLLSQQLVTNNFVIISGLAIGVDSIAHQTAIDTNGKTIAVLGCGVDCCAPLVNQDLYDKIIGRFGAIVSESAFGASGIKGIFPARNRIIAGLSLGVVVTEGAEDSGALITAERVKELRRPVFAVPGPITSYLSKGPNILAKSGATIITDASDIFQVFGIQEKKPVKNDLPKATNLLEKNILEMLANEQMHFDEIVRRMKKNSASIASTLSMMEVKGMIKSMDGGKYSLSF